MDRVVKFKCALKSGNKKTDNDLDLYLHDIKLEHLQADFLVGVFFFMDVQEWKIIFGALLMSFITNVRLNCLEYIFFLPCSAADWVQAP